MGKRRTYEERWNQKWYRKLLPSTKLFYDYIYDNVDWAGFIEYDVERVQFETSLSEEEIEGALKDLERVMQGASKGVIWLFDYIRLQGNFPLSENNKAHINIIRALDAQEHLFGKEKSFKEVRGFEGASKPPCNVKYSNSNVIVNKKDKEKLEAEAEKFDDAYKTEFDKARKLYPGIKRGLETEFKYFKDKHKDWKKVFTMLPKAIENQINARSIKVQNNEFVPEWKNFKTWITQRCWEEEVGVTKQVVAVG